MKQILSKVREFITKFKDFWVVLGVIFVLLLISLASQFIYNFIQPQSSSNIEQSDESSSENYEDCNVMYVELRGELYTYVPFDADGNKVEGYEDVATSEGVIYYLSDAEYIDNIKAVIMEVDSYGGSPAAGEEISETIKSMTKPVVAYIREAGLSAAYLSISPADYIFALKSSDVGSIGVTQSYVDNVANNQKEGYSFVELNSGKFKDSGSPDKPLTQEERNLFMRDLKIIHENFIKSVSENRNIAIEKVRSIADGSSVLGEQAKKLGLIDEIGDFTVALQYISDQIGEEAVVCW
jgi:protease IV